MTEIPGHDMIWNFEHGIIEGFLQGGCICNLPELLTGPDISRLSLALSAIVDAPNINVETDRALSHQPQQETYRTCTSD